VPYPELNTVVPIGAVKGRTVQLLQEQGRFSADLFERFRQAIRSRFPGWTSEGGPEEVFLPETSLKELIKNYCGDESGDFSQAIRQSVELRPALVHAIPSADDFTFFIDRKLRAAPAGAEITAGDVIEELFGKEIGTSHNGELWLWDEKAHVAASGRVLVCSCSKGKKWSVTFRRQQEHPPRKQISQFFNTFSDITGLLSSIIFARGSGEHGLVVVAGRTGSGKSQIARKLIQNYLHARRDGRIPHLVTFEDPIEKEFRGDDVAGADCTQRELSEDAKSLREVLLNALRQTPEVVFVGETRKRGDWKLLLEFAGTGHLVITTTHAGSLVEAMGNILNETDSHTPAARSIVADRLLAVVHLKNAVENKTKIPFLIPAIWHRTPLGVKALMAEGLSSLLPNTPPELDGDGAVRRRLPGSVGRYWFSRELVKRVRVDGAKESVKQKALEWDLEGI
jgi:hypothetical protein